MSEERLSRLIEDFSYRNLSLFFRDKCENYAETQEDLSQYDDEGFSDFQRLGEIRFDDGDKLVVTTSQVKGDLSERSGKKAQYEKAKKLLKELAVYDAGFFIFHDGSGSFRFSLVYGQAEGTGKSWSNFRRFTYFVSRDQTNKTFLDRVGGCDFSSLDVIKDAFSVEKVTKDFYKQIADWYFWAVQNATFPKDAEAEDNGRNIAVIRMITRLIFIWFMKERKLVSPDLFDQEKIAALLKSLKPDETTYYKAILQNLFFATLNTQKRSFRFTDSYHGKNRDYMNHNIYRYEDYFKNLEDTLAIFKDIPFLNGGLFDCLDWSAKESEMYREVRFDGFSDKEVGLRVPNYLFFSGEKEANLNKEYGTKNKKYHVQGLLNLLSAYNFTIDENEPNDQEVALDPELLGKVFENLLANFNPETATTARKATGSYYTPREIVDYMVTQSLKQYYKTHLNDVIDIDNKLEELLSPIIEDEPVNPFGADDSKRVVRLTEGLRIVDPAVGSGAFPMGILNKLVSVLARVDRDNKLWREAQLKAVEGVTDQLLKQKLVRQINKQFSERDSNYGRKLYLIQKCIYGVDIQQIAIEIAKLRFFIALLVDERIDRSKPNWGIEPLPNLDFKLMQGNSLISEFVSINLDAGESNSYGKLMKDETEELISEYRNRKTDYQYEPDRTKRGVLRNDIDKSIVRIFESKLHSQKAEYLTKLRNIERKYAGVPDIQQRDEAIRKDTAALNRNYGFDLAQTEKQLKEFTSGLKVKPFFAWRLYFAEVFHEKGGFDIVIANPPYVRADCPEIKEQRQLIMQSKAYQTLYEKWDLYLAFIERSFQILTTGGVLEYIIPDAYMSSKYAIKSHDYFLKNATIRRINFLNEIKVFEQAVKNIIIEFIKVANPQNVPLKVKHSPTFNDFIKSPSEPQEKMGELTFKVESENKIIGNLENTIQWGEICYVSVGLVLQAEERQWQGEFVKEDLISDKKDNVHKKSYIEAKWIQRYVIEKIKYLEWDTDRVPRKIRRPTFPELYLPPKIMMGGMTGAIFDDSGLLCNHSISVSVLWKDLSGVNNKSISGSIKKDFKVQNVPSFRVELEEKSKGVDLRYLLSILNSKLGKHYLSKVRRSQIGFYPDDVTKLPVKKIPKSQQKPFINLVDHILAITKGNDYQNSPAKQAKVKELERQIDRMVYELYGLTPEEIAVVEGSSGK